MQQINAYPYSGKQSKRLCITKQPWRNEANLVKWIVLQFTLLHSSCKLKKNPDYCIDGKQE